MTPDIELTRDEQALIVALQASSGFSILVRLAKAEVDKFIERLINTDCADKDAVLSNHSKAKTAAQLLEGFVKTLDEVSWEYTHTPRASDKPVDVTEGLIDLGDYTKQDRLPQPFWNSEEI